MNQNPSYAVKMDEIEETIINRLFDVNGIKLQEVLLKSGKVSPVYIDLRVLVSYPILLKQVSDLVWHKIHQLKLEYDVICGVPYTALPIATVISVINNKPMVMRRKEAKSYGTKQMIEGSFNPGDKALIIEDVITGGTSILETAIDLYRAGIQITDAIVLLDRDQGGAKNLEGKIKVHSVLHLERVVSMLSSGMKIENCTASKVVSWLKQNHGTLDPAVRKEWESVTDGNTQKNRKPFQERALLVKNEIAKRLFDIMATKETNVCVAIDVSTSRRVLELATQLAPFVCAVKIHVDIIEDFSFENLINPLIRLSEAENFMIFEDRKFADIGNTVKEQYGGGVFKIVEWAQLVTSHIIAGPGAIKALKLAASASNKDRGCLLLAQMSSDGNLLDKNFVQNVISAALKDDDFVAGFVCQERITSDPRFIHFTPGVSLESNRDSLGQVYSRPENAIEKGADVLIVGRALTEASDVVSAAIEWKKICFDAYTRQCKNS